MKLPVFMAAIMLGMCAVLVATFFIEEPYEESTDESGVTTRTYQGHGLPHPEHAQMSVGGSGAERGEDIFWLAFIFGALQIGFFVACLCFGLRKEGRVGPVCKLLLGGAVAYYLVWVGLMLTYRTYMHADSLDTFLGQPIPTAWMLYGIWPVPVFFGFVFVFGFKPYVWNEESEAAFRKIVEEKRAEGGQA